jgi:hypothetical protein
MVAASLRRNSTAACHAASKVAYDLGKRPRALSTAMTNIGFLSSSDSQRRKKFASSAREYFKTLNFVFAFAGF